MLIVSKKAVAVSVVFSTLFAFSALVKGLNFSELEDVLAKSILVPRLLVPYASLFAIAAELALAVSLAIPRTRVVGLRLAIWLISFFLAYSLWRSREGISAPCGCFVGVFTLPPIAMALVDGLLLILAVWALAPAARVPEAAVNVV